MIFLLKIVPKRKQTRFGFNYKKYNKNSNKEENKHHTISVYYLFIYI